MNNGQFVSSFPSNPDSGIPTYAQFQAAQQNIGNLFKTNSLNPIPTGLPSFQNLNSNFTINSPIPSPNSNSFFNPGQNPVNNPLSSIPVFDTKQPISSPVNTAAPGNLFATLPTFEPNSNSSFLNNNPPVKNNVTSFKAPLFPPKTSAGIPNITSLFSNQVSKSPTTLRVNRDPDTVYIPVSPTISGNSKPNKSSFPLEPNQQKINPLTSIPVVSENPIITETPNSVSKPIHAVPTTETSASKPKAAPFKITPSIVANDAPKNFKDEEDVTIHAYDWTEQDEYNPDGSSMTINCWGLSRDDKPHLLRINNMAISCFLELNPKVDGKFYHWDDYAMRKVCEYMNKCMGANRPEMQFPTYMKKLYYYRDNHNVPGEAGHAKYPMIALIFRNKDQLRHCRNLMTNKPRFIPDIGTITCNVWEDDISSIRKMLTLRKMKYSQWFNVKGRKVPQNEKISKLENEFYIDFKDINPIDPTESKSWVTHPGVFSVDIETYSDNKKALPNKTNPKHPCYLITIVYQRTGLPETRKRIAIFMGEFFKEVEKDYTVIKVNTEVELCDKMCELIGELDPEILIGWNIFGYDYPYLDARLKMRNEEWSDKASRIISKKPYLRSDNWASSGYGLNEMNILVMEGRINIDEMMVVKRDYKLPRYNLDTAAKKFVKKSKHPVTAEQMFTCYENLDEAILLFNRIVEDYDDDNNPKFFDNISPEVIEQVALKLQNAIDEMKKVIDYGIQDSDLPMDIFDKINTWIGLIQLSNIVGVTVTEIFTRGQQIRGLSQLYDLAHDPKYNYVLDKKPASKIDWVGGFVNDPIPGLHEYVSCLDFKSLYPSIIIAFNICYTTFVPFELMDQIPDEKCNIIEWDEVPDDDKDDDEEDDEGEGLYDDDGIRKKAPKQITHYKYKFIKKEYKEGLIPILVGNLIRERRRIVALVKIEPDPVTKVVLDKMQWGLKISANSVFGMLGAEMGKRPFVEAAMCITAMGRKLIEMANTILSEEYGKIVLYNDTDSTFFKNPNATSAMQAIQEANELEKIISDRYPDPLYFEHEKSGRVLLLKKKKYAFWFYDMKTGDLLDPETDEDAILMRGIVLARRDNCQYQRDFYYQVLYGILRRKGMQEILDIIVEQIDRLYRDKVEWSDLTMIKGLGAHYKSETYFMKVFSDELRRIGKPQAPGSRLDYVIVEDGRGETLLGKKMRLPETYLERRGTDEEEKIDALYYIEKVVTNCIEQLWQITFAEQINAMEPEYERQDYMSIMNILLNDPKKGQFVYQIYQQCGWNPMLAYETLHTTKEFKMKGKCELAYREIKGMKAFIPRITLNPIKLLKKAILNNRYQETVKILASKELYAKLYPDDKGIPEQATFNFNDSNTGGNNNNNFDPVFNFY